MRAILQTKCGCTREINVVDIVPEIVMPLDGATRMVRGDLSVPDNNIRKFRLHKTIVDDFNAVVLIYREAVE